MHDTGWIDRMTYIRGITVGAVTYWGIVSQTPAGGWAWSVSREDPDGSTVRNIFGAAVINREKGLDLANKAVILLADFEGATNLNAEAAKGVELTTPASNGGLFA